MLPAPDPFFPDIGVIKDLLHLDSDNATIFMGEQRMVLLHTKTFGSLRAELIAALGIHTTRALLTRMGYSSGARDAELALRVHTPKEVIYNLVARGGQLHAIEGIVLVKPLKTEIDVTNGHCFLEFLWENSVEDEMHIDSIGVGTSAACWMEMGYASGFLSACMGKRILAREVECRSMGMDVCRVIAQPAAKWLDPETDLQYLEMPIMGRQVESHAAPGEVAANAKDKDAAKVTAAQSSLIRSKHKAEVVGLSPTFQVVLQKVRQVAPTNATVLLLGESGVGKSAFARLVHEQSVRAERPFVAINCAAIPETLMESELFGVERGAFTGANVSRAGRFELAEGGTLFLDEVGTLPLTAQSKLLRVLETGQYERLGSGVSQTANVRMVAATNGDLWTAVRAGRFREDLFFRLNVFPLEVPPLRHRKEDVPVLVEHFMQRFTKAYSKDVKGITPEAATMLISYAWPGNIRELSNVIERAVILCENNRSLDMVHLLTLKDLSRSSDYSRAREVETEARQPRVEPPLTGDQTGATDSGAVIRQLLQQPGVTLDSVEEMVVRAIIDQTGGNVSRAASILGITRGQLSYRLKKIER